jgi:hypothetical protein
MAQGPNAPYTNLDQNQILQRAFEENEDRLRVDAEVTATIGTIECIINAASGDNIAITNQDGTNPLQMEPDGSITVNVQSSVLPTGAATEATLSTLNSKVPSQIAGRIPVDGSGVTQPISATSLPLPTGAATEAKQDIGNTTLSTIDSKLNTLGQKTSALSMPVVLASDSTIPLPTGAATEATLSSIDTKLSGTIAISAVALPLPTGAATEATLTNIDTKLPTLGTQVANDSISVTFASDIPALNVELDAFVPSTPDNVLLVGSIDGTKTGTKYGFVNNLRSQILATQDRDQQITYADFGTKDQRIIEIDYSSPTFPGITAKKTINYTPVSGKYRRDSIIWSIV